MIKAHGFLLCLSLLLAGPLRIPAQERPSVITLTEDSLIKKRMTAAQADIKAGRYDIAIASLQGLAGLQTLSQPVKDMLPNIYQYIGTAYIFKGDYERAIQYSQLAAALARKQPGKYPSLLIRIYNNLSVVKNRLAENEEALQYLEEAGKIARNTNHTAFTIGIVVNKGRIYKEMGRWQESEQQFVRALALISSTALDKSTFSSSEETRQIVFTNMGQLYLQQVKPEQALTYFEKAQLLSRKGTNPYNTIPTLLGLGKANLALKRYKAAETYLQEALSFAKEKKVADGEIEALQNLSKLYAATQAYEKAYHYQLAYTQKENELRGTAKVGEIRKLETRYHLAEKDRQLTENKLQILQQQKNITRKNLWIYGICAGVFMLLFMGIIVYRNLRHKQRNQKNQIQLLQQEKEINQLKALMQGEERERKRIAHELHDGIGGMLAAVKMHFSAFKNRHELQHSGELTLMLHMLENTSDEVRKTAHNLMPSVLLKHSLSEALETYCHYINAMGRLHIQFHEHGLPLHIPKDFELMVYRTIQELIQNILKHADATMAAIELEYRDHKFNITVEDNGRGFDTTHTAAQGYGLQNITFKVLALQGSINIESAPGMGCTISISFSGEQVQQSFYSTPATT